MYNGSLLYTIVSLSRLVSAGMRLMCTIVAYVYNGSYCVVQIGNRYQHILCMIDNSFCVCFLGQCAGTTCVS